MTDLSAVPAIEQQIDPRELLQLIQQRNPLLVESCAQAILLERLRQENAALRAAAPGVVDPAFVPQPVVVPAASEVAPGTPQGVDPSLPQMIEPETTEGTPVPSEG